MRCCKRIISCILVFAILCSTVILSVTPAFAYTQGELIRDEDSVDAWSTWMELNVPSYDFVDFSVSFWNVIDQCFGASGCGAVDYYPAIMNSMELWNGHMHRFDAMNILALTIFYALTGSSDIPTAYVAFDSELGVYRLREYHTDLWLVNSSGYFPYYEPPKDEGGNTPAEGEDITGITWRPFNDAFGKQADRHLITLDVLSDLAGYYNGSIIRYDRYYVIVTTDPVLGGYLYLCDESGYPYCNIIDDSSTAAGTPNDYYVDNSMTITNNGQLIDIENGVVWFPDGTMYYIDQLIYDESTQSYIVDSHDQYTYNSISNSFNTTHYYFSYNFYITHTSITYIGQTGEYEKPYELYYELPDGRSSADLTAEELEQLSLVFADVINYARSADDINMRALYHFDGNLDDSSYWSYCSSFDWVDGASITYMDEGTFGGSLYLDEIAHYFNVVLPSADLSADFTIQFRYYQSYTPAPYMDSFIMVGSVPVLYFDGCGFYYPDRGAELFGFPGVEQTSGDWYIPEICYFTPYSVGSWQEIALIREGDMLFYYINGVCYGGWPLVGSYGDTITFVFGSDQQTYKKLDELRVTKGALVSGGESYIPSAVPYDTNLALILPDGEVPIADEYYTFVPAENNLVSFDFTDLDSLNIVDFGPPSAFGSYYQSNSSYAVSLFEDFFAPFGLYTFSSTASISQLEDGISISVNDSSTLSKTYIHYGSVSSQYSIYWEHLPQNCLALCISPDGYMVNSRETVFYDEPEVDWITPSPDAGKVYTVSVVDTSGNLSTLTFETAQGTYNYDYVSSVFTTFDIYMTRVLPYGADSDPLSCYAMRYYNGFLGDITMFSGPSFLYFVPRSGDASIAYMEIVEGSEPAYEFVWHEAVYSSGELQESPVLAVKSNTPVSDYQIGGVRPSYPTKGQVWALVENQRITSLQQYSGYAWLAVDGRIWTGSRWIPTSSFNVFTLQDMWDVQGVTPKDEYIYIYTESGFWDWWQKQWYSFTGTLFDKLDGSGGSGGDPVPDLEDDPLINEDDKQKFDDTEYTGIVKLLRQSYEFVSDFFSGFTMGGVQNFLSQLTDPASPIFGLFWVNGL